MIVKFKQEIEDVYGFNEYHYWSAPERKWYRLKSYLLLPLIAVAFLSYQTLNVDADIRGKYLLNLGFPVLAVVFIYVFTLKGFVKSRLRRNAGKLLKQSKNEEMLGVKEFQFTDKNIIMQSLYSKNEMGWESIEKVRWDKRFYFLYQNALMAFVIPKKAIEDKEAFEKLLKSKKQ